MGRFILRRLLQVIPLLIGISIITFALANLVPGSPVSGLEFNPRTTPEDIARIKENLGLNDPVWKRYFIWIGNVAQGDLGISLKNFRPVRETIMDKLPNTLLLTGTALLLALAVAIPIGVYGAVRRNSAFDNITTATSVAGFSVPTFWLGLMLILLFAVKFKEWGLPSFPAGGSYDLRGGGGFFDRLEHLILPAFALAFVQMAAWTRYIRSQMLEVLNQDYMRTANAKGLRERIVIFRHGLRNAILPLVTLLGIAIPDLFAGSLIIENIFTYPGIGQLAFNAAINKDYPLIMGITLVAGTLVILGNLIADVVYSLLDPRIRLD
ncbi:MAG TPA: ABC transporter permease [Thermomicrobiales bacterium]|nr:ABC transporter permease [Thermomicrobiales bacterium]